MGFHRWYDRQPDHLRFPILVAIALPYILHHWVDMMEPRVRLVLYGLPLLALASRVIYLKWPTRKQVR